MDTCYERPEKYTLEALRLLTESRKYKVSYGAANRDLYYYLGQPSTEPKQWVTERFSSMSRLYPALRERCRLQTGNSGQ
jgi:hypothetical protein